jgi:hypothetical protein
MYEGELGVGEELEREVREREVRPGRLEDWVKREEKTGGVLRFDREKVLGDAIEGRDTTDKPGEFDPSASDDVREVVEEIVRTVEVKRGPGTQSRSL